MRCVSIGCDVIIGPGAKKVRCDGIFGPGVKKRAGVLYFGLKTQIEQNLFIDSYTYYDITNYRYINFICAMDRS